MEDAIVSPEDSRWMASKGAVDISSAPPDLPVVRLAVPKLAVQGRYHQNLPLTTKIFRPSTGSGTRQSPEKCLDTRDPVFHFSVTATV
jgi:hypothetical protein